LDYKTKTKQIQKSKTTDEAKHAEKENMTKMEKSKKEESTVKINKSRSFILPNNLYKTTLRNNNFLRDENQKLSQEKRKKDYYNYTLQKQSSQVRIFTYPQNYR
jgi:hypothetical protein